MLDYPFWPAGWEVLELNPARVGEQRRIHGRRRVKTDAIDLEAITELLLAGQGQPAASHDRVIGELTAWAPTGPSGSPPVAGYSRTLTARLIPSRTAEDLFAG